MTSKLLGSVIRGTLNFIMPASPSIDEHSVLVNETGTASARTKSAEEFQTRSYQTWERKGRQQERNSKQGTVTRKAVEGTIASKISSGRASPSCIKDHTRKRKAAAQESAKELARDVEALREQLRSSQKDLLDANLKFTNAKKRIRTLEGEKHSLADQYKTAEQIHADRLKTARGRLADLEARNRKQEEELQILREKVRVADEKNHNLGKLLEERTADFKGTQTFMTTAAHIPPLRSSAWSIP
ncbi:hypothetical protein CVT25_013248 [Psilocybe cyanescens]|uniref:Uncharacterized protein n=1 Tax=Psilocybe cyanescens TaxID=93625 RepID=A0A409X0U7_PSICY|nr:hypothetical protein CVT25_013248 [Psilocybe cyanescens]